MFNKILGLFKTKSSFVANNAVEVTFLENSELDNKFWKLLHDDTLSQEEEMLLASEIEAELLECKSLPHIKSKGIYNKYRKAVRLCHPDLFSASHDISEHETATMWFQHVQTLYQNNDLLRLSVALRTLEVYAESRTLPSLEYISKS